jgi:hypothetical protein
MLSTAKQLMKSSLLGRKHTPTLQQVRFLNVHEYISMELMQTHGITTPNCYVATTPEQAEHIFNNSLNKRTYNVSIEV